MEIYNNNLSQLAIVSLDFIKNSLNPLLDEFNKVKNEYNNAKNDSEKQFKILNENNKCVYKEIFYKEYLLKQQYNKLYNLLIVKDIESSNIILNTLVQITNLKTEYNNLLDTKFEFYYYLYSRKLNKILEEIKKRQYYNYIKNINYIIKNKCNELYNYDCFTENKDLNKYIKDLNKIVNNFDNLLNIIEHDPSDENIIECSLEMNYANKYYNKIINKYKLYWL